VAAGATNCTGRAISLSKNGTGSASDSATAHVEIDMKTDLPIGNASRTIEFWAYIQTMDWIGENNQLYYYGGSGDGASFGLDFGTPTGDGHVFESRDAEPVHGRSELHEDSTADLGINSSTISGSTSRWSGNAPT
jgi:hypothetical protein